MMPDTPTLPELGVPAGGQVLGATRLFALPDGVPEDRRAYLAASILSVLGNDATKAAFADAGLTLTPEGPEAAAKSYQETFDRLHDFLEESGRLSD